MNFPTLIILLIVVGIFALIVTTEYKNKKNGKPSCSGCAGCNGVCGCKIK